MVCKKCKKEIPDGSTFCNFCGRKQEQAKPKHRKRLRGTGTISKDSRYKNPYIAHAPSTASGCGRVYLGAYATVREAQDAIDDYIKRGRPDLYTATLADIYALWSDVHFKEVSKSAVDLYRCTWKRFAPIAGIKMTDIRTAHIQQIVDTGKSKSACEIAKTLAGQLCRYAMQNDLINKNYANFAVVPKFEKKEKRILTAEERAILWEHSDDERAQIILVMIYTGFRVGELLALRPRDIDLDGGYIVGGEKTAAGRDRVVPLPENIPEIKKFVAAWTVGKAPDERIFPYSSNKFRSGVFYAVLADLGISDPSEPNHLTPHSTRHTFATLASSAGIKADALQKIIGHSNYSTTIPVPNSNTKTHSSIYRHL